jgi:hypothetical protein
MLRRRVAVAFFASTVLLIAGALIFAALRAGGEGGERRRERQGVSGAAIGAPAGTGAASYLSWTVSVAESDDSQTYWTPW